MTSLLSIAYLSVSTQPMTRPDIESILMHARASNERIGITGALLYHGGRFVQIIEGPDEVVTERFTVISADPRHRSVQLMRKQRIAERQFPEWTMGFRELPEGRRAELDGFEDFFSRRGRSRIEHAENEAQQFLEWLSEYWLPRP